MTRKNARAPFRLSLFLGLLIVSLTTFRALPALADGCLFPAPPGAPYKLNFSLNPASGQPSGAPLTIVVLGDSILWGDGDKDHHKIAYLVGQGIADQTGRHVDVHSYAHSGALLSNPGTEPSGFPTSGSTPLGNLDAARPAVTEQAACAASAETSVNYVLLEGCINEVGATNIALPPIFTHVTPSQIRTSTFNACAKPMRNTLTQVAKAFPNARILLLNYYRVVSKTSKPKAIVAAAAAGAPNDKEKAKEQKELERAVKREVKLARKQNPAVAPALQTEAEQTSSVQHWRDNSAEFLDDVTSCFRWAVASANDGDSSDPGNAGPGGGPVCEAYKPHSAPAPASQRISLVIFPDNDDYAYGAKDTILWLAPIPLFLGLAIHPDELFFKRNWECDFHLGRGDLACKFSPIAHPNVKGAAIFSQSILDIVKTLPPASPPAS
jgi:hypothetical protein